MFPFDGEGVGFPFLFSCCGQEDLHDLPSEWRNRTDTFLSFFEIKIKGKIIHTLYI